MATKNLARTIIEGGRMESSTYERRNFTRRERVAVRHFLWRTVRDVDLYDERVMPARRKAYKEYKDNFGPAYRWLRSRVGKSWNKTHAILFKKFNARTTAKCHFVFSHLLKEAQAISDCHRYFSSEYIVDDKGILTYKPRKTDSYYEPNLKHYEPKVSEWMHGRRIILHGKIFFWLVPTVSIGKIGPIAFLMRRVSYRQDAEFSPKDSAYFHSLSSRARKELLKMHGGRREV